MVSCAWLLRIAVTAVVVAVVAAAAHPPAARADDDRSDRVAELISELSAEADDARERAAVAELVSIGDAARVQIGRALDETDEHRDRLLTALDALDAATRLRADADAGGLAFWAALDEARTRTIVFDAVLRAAIPDPAARKRVEDADRHAAGTVDAFLAAAPAGADLAAWRDKLAAAGPPALVRLLDAAVGPDPKARIAAISALTALKSADAVPHLVFVALVSDDPAATDALRALDALAGYVPVASRGIQAQDVSESEAVIAWWDERKPRGHAAARHLAHRVLLDLAAPGVRGAEADERIERLARVLFGGRGGLWVEECDDTGGETPRLTDASVERVRGLWRWNLPPATWRAATAVLRTATCYDGPWIGEGGEVSSTRRAYDVLEQDAPVDAIARLLAAPEPVLRLYAFRALTVREGLSPRALDAFERIARSAGEVATQSGCIRQSMRLGDAALDDLATRTDDGRRTILEFLLDRDLRLDGLRHLLEDVPLDRVRRPQVRKLVEEDAGGALMALAHWHDAEDAATFASRLEAAGAKALDDHELLEAIKEHGATGTMERLVQLAPAARKRCAQDDRWSPATYVAALAASGDAAAEAGLLSLVGADPAKTPARLLHDVGAEIGSAPDDAFTALRWRLWEAVPWTRAAAVPAMARTDRERAVTLALRDLGRPLPGSGLDPESAELIPARLGLVRAADPAAAAAAVAGLLHAVDYTVARAIAPLICAWRDDRLVEPLFGALTSADNPHAFLPIARVLFAYDRPEIDERMRKAAAATEPLHKGWGGERLARLLASPPRTWEAGERSR